ncbi:MAG: hypothetical protein MUC87_10320 [Bacteroidia bacterium]|jgi:hypothetical protein|nr:hypothetical protein [Bacteroidia bacterium]
MLKQIKHLKKSLTVTFREVLSQPNATFNVRIFTPLKGRKKLILRLIKNEKYFILKNIDGLAENQIKELCFKVSPEPIQGLVGLTYQLKDITYDPSPNKPPDKAKTSYHLDSYQSAKTSNVGFITAAPIFSPNSEIIAIVTVDSEINIGTILDEYQERELRKIFQEYCDNYLSEVLSLIK